MSDAKKDSAFDPFEPWRGMRDAYMSAWSKSMVDAVNSGAYAEATGAMLDTYLTASAPFRETVEKAMTEALQQLSMPTRQDVTSMAERLTNVEMRLDDLDATMERIERLLARVYMQSADQKGGSSRDRQANPRGKSERPAEHGSSEKPGSGAKENR